MVDTLMKIMNNLEEVKNKTCKRHYGLGFFRPGNAVIPKFVGAIEAQIEQALGLLKASQDSIKTAVFLKQASDEADKLLRRS